MASALVMMFSGINYVKAQDLGRIIGAFGEGLTIGAVLKNPNLQSTDMKNFYAFINAGHNCYNNGKYGEAMSHYSEANNIVCRTNDKILIKVYYNYGMKDNLVKWYNNAYAKYKLENPTVPQQNYVPSTTQGYFGNTYSAPSTTQQNTTQKSVCRLCKGTGLKIKEHYSSGQRKWCYTCNKEVGTGHLHVRCDLCNGTGMY